MLRRRQPSFSRVACSSIHSHIIRLLNATSVLVAVAGTIVCFQRFTQQDAFDLRQRQRRRASEVDLLNYLKA